MTHLRALGLCLFLLCVFQMPVATQETDDTTAYITFVAPGAVNDDIIVADLNTGDVANISNNRVQSAHPTWSGDGSQIAYNNVFTDGDGNFTDIEVFVSEANGLDARNVTNNPAFDVSPDWSPVTDEIVFQSNRDGGNDLYIVDVTSGETRRLTTDGLPKNRPEWSPDGAQITYWQLEDDQAQLQVVDANTGTVNTITAEGQNLWPSWSPDGETIAVHDNSREFSQIVLVDVASGERTIISDGTASDFRPEWSPDGAQIAFYREQSGAVALFVMDADGSNVQLFSEDIGADRAAAWRPTSTVIDFGANPSIGLSAVRVNADSVDASDQFALGDGIRRLYAPQQASYEERIPIRLEIQLDDPDIVPDAEPPAELREEGSIDVYRIMGAELEGADLEDFRILPENGFLLQIQEDSTNYWDWLLIPNGPESVGTKFIFVNIYLPDIDDDGVVTKTVIDQILLEFEVITTDVVAQDPPQSTMDDDVERVYTSDTPSLNLPNDNPTGAFSVYHGSRDLLAVRFSPEVDFTSVSVASERVDFGLLQLFPALRAFEDRTPDNDYCVLYERQDEGGAAPIRPLDCQIEDQFMRQLAPSDVFWFDRNVNAFTSIIIRKNNESYYCPADVDRCDF